MTLAEYVSIYCHDRGYVLTTKLAGSDCTLPSVNALMTIPNAERDLLIFLASSKVCPDAPVFPT